MTVKSPLIPNGDVELVRSFSTKDIVRKYSAELGIDVARFFNSNEAIPLYRCIESDYRFFGTSNLEGDPEFYAEVSKFDWYYDNWRWEHEKTIKFIKNRGKILDIGCGAGAFVSRASKIGFNALGIETNPAALMRAKNLDLNVKNQTIESLIAAGEKFDACTMFQVLEHIHDVGDLLRKLPALLNPDGLIVVGVPNNNPYLFRFEDMHTLNLPPHHVGLWNRRSLEKIAEILNFELVEIIVEPLFERAHFFNVFLLTFAPWLQTWLRLKIAKVFAAISGLFPNIIEGRNLLAVYQLKF